MTSLTSLIQDTYTRRRTTVIAVGLILTALVPVAQRWMSPTSSQVFLALGALVLAATLLLMVGPSKLTGPAEGSDPEGGHRLGADLLLYLSPVILLNLTYPLVSPQMAAAGIGGVQLTLVVLASSITVPWLAQAACLPAYRAIEDLIADRDMSAITARFCAFWPAMFVQALPLVVLFAVPLWLATGWSYTAMAVYAVLCGLHVLFVQSLVLANVGQRRGLWALAWSVYAGALFLVPTAWWLPPLAATLTQLVAMGRGLRCAGVPRRFSPSAFFADTTRGLLLGSVLWADKFVLFLVTGGWFPVVTVFMAMLPAVLAYNFYFVRLAPQVDQAVARLHTTIAEEPLEVLALRSQQVSRIVDRSVLRTGAIGMALALGVSLLLDGLRPAEVLLVVCVALGSWAFMMLTLLSYELDYIGERTVAQGLGALHLLVCVLAFVVLGVPETSTGGAGAYAGLLVADLLLVGGAWVLYKRHWSQPEYTLFWRHATTW